MIDGFCFGNFPTHLEAALFHENAKFLILKLILERTYVENSSFEPKITDV